VCWDCRREAVTASAAPARLRDLTPGDVAGAWRLSQAAGWNQREEDWRTLLALNPGRFVGAVRDDRLVGSGGAVCYGDVLAWVCMILVDPPERGQGLGTRLVEAILERLADMRLIGLDATPAGQGVYARLGFIAVAKLLRMGRDRGGDRAEVPPAAAGASPAEPLAARDLDAVLGLDREVFGADRAAVLRWLFARAPAAAWCVRDGGAVTGYCFGRSGILAEQVGPVVAQSVPAARALVAAAAARATGDRMFVDADAERADWLSALAGLGFREQRPLVRMYRGATQAPGRPDLQLAILGPEFG
jgi:GNAT superfamily N-acetyltransferase